MVSCDSGENVPFTPVLHPQRNVDVFVFPFVLISHRSLIPIRFSILAIDGSADTNNFPDGREPRNTCTSSLLLQSEKEDYNNFMYDGTDLKSLLPGYAGNLPMPYFPTNESFVAQGLHQRISFFGSICTGVVPETPLIVYVPNYNVVAATNTSTLIVSYNKREQLDFFNNGSSSPSLPSFQADVKI